jgi:NAD+ synthase
MRKCAMKRSLNFDEVRVKTCNGIKRFFKKTKAKKVIIGISGGADSALVAAFCVEALGKENVLGILMPYGKQVDINDSIDLSKGLKIDYRIIDIKPIVDSFIGSTEDGDMFIKGNIMSRSRMIILYSIANKYKGIVAGTTNKSEMAIGYGTKFGDLACDFEVIEELYKTEIWELLKKISMDIKLPILEKIAAKKPTAGLWCGQTDEEELGFNYETLDAFLQGEKTDKEKELKIKKLIKISAHKRHLPPCIKI